MTKPNPRTLQHIEAAIAECDRVHSEAEVREAAERLGVEDMLPDPQEELDLPRAA